MSIIRNAAAIVGIGHSHFRGKYGVFKSDFSVGSGGVSINAG